MGRILSLPAHYLQRVNAARYFMRREDYQPRRTPPESPLREFDAKCLRCESYQLAFTQEFNEESGETLLVLRCRNCAQIERLPVR